MDAQTLDTYTNVFLFVTVIGGAAFALYRATRKKPVDAREVPKKPESFRPKTKDSEEVYEGHPITDFREMPARSPMHDAIVKPPSFKPVQRVKEAGNKPLKPIFKKASTGTHSPYRANDEATEE
jgi:hypothetical protein